jgi:hypothetical protein
MGKAATVMASLLIEGDVNYKFRTDSLACDSWFDTEDGEKYGTILIEGDTINFVDHDQQFDVNEDETSLNDFVAELATH